MEKQRTVSEWADFWRYEIGVNVIPANTKYKKPIVNWTEWQTTPIPKEVHDQWKKDGLFNNGMAVIVGKVFHNNMKNGLYLCAIDCDNEMAIKELMPKGVLDYAEKTLIELHMDDSTKCHVYFYTTQPVPKKSSDTVNPKQAIQLKKNEIPALEVKGDGKHGIMYVTPSMHKNGTRYEIIGNEQPKLLDEVVTVIDNICKKYNIPYLSAVKNGNSMIPMNEILQDDTEIAEGHNRHLAMLRYADHVYSTSSPSITQKMVIEMLKAKNKLLCNPPLDEDELLKLQEQAREKTQNWKKEKTDEDERGHSEIADEIMDEFNFITMDDTDEILYYNEGVYKFGGEIIIKKRCEQTVDGCSRDLVNEVIAAIRRRTYNNRNNFDQDTDMLNLKNCWFNIKTGENFKHSPQMLSRIQLPVFYDSSKIPIKFNLFLRQCLNKPKDVFTVYEQFASCLIKSARFGKAFMYVGQGANGKSVFLHVIKNCLGIENTSHISIHSFEENRFSSAELDGKMANIYADISNEELNNAGTFKNLVTGDPIIAEKKNKNPFTLTNFAKMFFSANQIPVVYDESDGFFRRFMIIEWNKKFDDKIANVTLKEELVSEDEKSGIFNILVCLVRELDKRGFYKYADSVETLRNKWKNKADSVGGFTNNCVFFEENCSVEKTRLYNAYLNYCTENKLFHITRKKFQDEIKQNTPMEDTGKPMRIDVTNPSWRYCNKDQHSKLVRVWNGGMLKNDVVLQDNRHE